MFESSDLSRDNLSREIGRVQAICVALLSATWSIHPIQHSHCACFGLFSQLEVPKLKARPSHPDPWLISASKHNITPYNGRVYPRCCSIIVWITLYYTGPTPDPNTENLRF